MDRQQGFFSVLREEVARGMSPGRSRTGRTRSPSPSGSGFLRRRRSSSVGPQETLNSRPGVDSLSPLREEGPDPKGWANWLCRAPSVSTSEPDCSRSVLRVLLGVMGAPLGPVHVSNDEPWPHLCIKNNPIEYSSAQYILHQYLAASGGHRLQGSIQNAYATGKVKMTSYDLEITKSVESGGFVLWRKDPDMWYVELELGGSKLRAGCNGRLVWRHTPWLGAHAANGPIRPLRRALQGLDPRTTANMFAGARCAGEKKVNGEQCFVLKLSADPVTLKSRSEGAAEIVRHVMFGYFSQKTGLLVHLEDSHLTRIPGGVYWETAMSSALENYRFVEGVMMAHSGRSVVTLVRFGESPTKKKTRMEEAWVVEEVAFNVPGLSGDCFTPPAELRKGSVSESRNREAAEYRAKVSALVDQMNDVVNVSRLSKR